MSRAFKRDLAGLVALIMTVIILILAWAIAERC